MKTTTIKEIYRGTDKLVYYEIYQYIQDAIEREKQVKVWQRKWKIELIEKENPTWRDLFHDMV
jgi:putative endonuclease